MDGGESEDQPLERAQPRDEENQNSSQSIQEDANKLCKRFTYKEALVSELELS